MPAILTGLQTWVRKLMIRSAAVAGIGAAKTLARLQSFGLGIRRTVGLALYREFAGIPARANLVKYIPKKLTPGRALYTEAVGIMTRRYRYTVTSEFFIRKTGETQTRHTSLISDRPLSTGEIERTGGEVLHGLAGLYGATITKQWISLLEHREGDAWG